MSKHMTNTHIATKCTGCNHEFTILSTLSQDQLLVETCNKCHPAYTGKKRKLAAGAVEKFSNKYKGFDKLFSNNDE